MTTSTPPDNTVLVLSPPMVNGQTKPVEGAHIGVPLVAYDLVTDGEGAVVLVDPPLSGTMDPGDVMELWLEGESAALDSETIKDPNSRTTLRIPKGRLHPDQVNKLYCTVTRGSSNIGTSTPLLEILYNRIRPGWKDRQSDPYGHSELKLLLPDVIKNGVGPDFVSAEVCVAYPYCRAYDLITLKCNGEYLEPKPRVNPNQAPQPPNPGFETPITICFTITRAFLDKAKREDKKLVFVFSVTDQIGNGPDTDAPWSPPQTVTEDLDGTLLPMPILREKLNDPDDKPETIDLEKLAGGPLLVVVLTGDNRFQAGDSVTAEYIARVNGQPDVVVRVNGTVEKDEFGQKINCILRIDNDKVIAGSSVTVTYELRRPNGDLVGNSIEAKAKVDGTAPVDLLPPTLVAPATSPVDVLAYEDGVTVRIEHLAALPGDHAQLKEVDPIAGTPPFPLVLINQNKRANFKFTSAFLVTRRGTTGTFYWELVRDGKPVGKSPGLVLVINAIAENDPRLPMPTIDGVTSQELKVYELRPDARVLTTKIPLKQLDHPVWVDYQGIDNDGNPINLEVWRGEPSESAETISVDAAVEWLSALKDGRELKLACAVSLDGANNKATAIHLLSRSYISRTYVETRPEINSVKDTNMDDIPNEGITHDTSITFGGIADRNEYIQLYDNGVATSAAVRVRPDGGWSHTIDKLDYAKHSFIATALYGNELSSAPPRNFEIIESATVENFDQLVDKNFAMGEELKTKVLTIKRLLTSNQPNNTMKIQTVDTPHPEKLTGKVIHIVKNYGGQSLLELRLDNAFREVHFWIKSKSSHPALHVLFRMNETFIECFNLNIPPTEVPTFITLNTLNTFNSIEIKVALEASHTLQLDNFHFYKNHQLANRETDKG